MPSAAEFGAAKLVQMRAEAKFIWIMPSAADLRRYAEVVIKSELTKRN